MAGCCVVNGVIDPSFTSQEECETIIFGCEELMGPWDSNDGPHPPCPDGWVATFDNDDIEQRYKYCYQYSFKIFDGITCNCPTYTSTNQWYGKWPGSNQLTGFNLYIDSTLTGDSTTGPGPNAIFISDASCDDLPQRVWVDPCNPCLVPSNIMTPPGIKTRFFNQPIEQIPDYNSAKPQILTHAANCGLMWFTIDQCMDVVTCLSLQTDKIKVTRNKIAVIKDFGPLAGDEACDILLTYCPEPSPSPPT